MALWRFGQGWTEAEMRGYLADTADRPVNFTAAENTMVPGNGWTVDGADALIGREPAGPPLRDGLFERARQGIENYDFSDPRVVRAHFDPRAPLSGRNMLLEIKVFGLRFLNGVRVQAVRNEESARETVFGFRYDTLQGHIERGSEWFLLRKEHETGAVYFKIEAHWRMGDFPNWWSELGFRLFGRLFRNYWRSTAARRLRALAVKDTESRAPAAGKLAHPGKEEPERTESTP